MRENEKGSEGIAFAKRKVSQLTDTKTQTSQGNNTRNSRTIHLVDKIRIFDLK